MAKQRSRIVIRQPRADDADEFIALMRRSRTLHRPFVKPPLTHDAFDAYLDRLKDGRHTLFFACLRDSGQIVGVVNLNEIVRGSFQSAYLGYYIGRGFEQRGFMSSALSQTLDYAFGSLKLHRVEANICPENEPSIALVRKLGFRLEGLSPKYLKVGGRWRDHERWAMLADDWRRHRSTIRHS